LIIQSLYNPLIMNLKKKKKKKKKTLILYWRRKWRLYKKLCLCSTC